MAEFTYNSGFSVVQKQKNILAIHTEYKIRYPQGHILEISSKSTAEEGRRLSAFSLLTRVPDQTVRVPVENVYQSSKFFADGGPYLQLLTISPKDAKRSALLTASGAFRGYIFDGKEMPSEPAWLYYNWLYLRALCEPENADLAAILEEYDAFTDIEFNPAKSLNCQARATAMVYNEIIKERYFFERKRKWGPGLSNKV